MIFRHASSSHLVVSKIYKFGTPNLTSGEQLVASAGPISCSHRLLEAIFGWLGVLERKCGKELTFLVMPPTSRIFVIHHFSCWLILLLYLLNLGGCGGCCKHFYAFFMFLIKTCRSRHRQLSHGHCRRQISRFAFKISLDFMKFVTLTFIFPLELIDCRQGRTLISLIFMWICVNIIIVFDLKLPMVPLCSIFIIK